MMDWYLKGRRGLSWRDRTLESVSSPPAPLLVVFGLVVLLMSLASYSGYKAQVRQTVTGLKLVLFLLPVVMILVVHFMMGNKWFYYVRGKRPTAYEESAVSRHHEGSSPWWLAVVVVVLLVLVYFQTYVQSAFRLV